VKSVDSTQNQIQTNYSTKHANCIFGH